MESIVRLKKTGSGWEFDSETALEDFVWANLQQLLGLTALKRQYRVNGQICDILAVDENRRLVVLELKNNEDRYIVQQLTRYYDALLEEKPFSAEIDYGQTVRLVAITPSFHQDNLTDRKYHKLFFQFLQFEITQNEQILSIHLKDIETGKVEKIGVTHQEKNSLVNIPPPPKKLFSLLVNCNTEEQEAILRVREKILKFDLRMQEVTDSVSVKYGKGKSKPCAELRFDKTRNNVALFLWLPIVSGRFSKRNVIVRMRIWTDWEKVSDVGHVPKALGRMITKNEWLLGSVRPLNKLLPGSMYKTSKENYIKSYREDESYRSGLAMSFTWYMKLIGKTEESESLNMLVDMALETWLKRL